MLFGLRACRVRAAASAMHRAVPIGLAEQAADLAGNRARPGMQQSVGRRLGAGILTVECLPNCLTVEHRIRRDHDQHEGAERIQRWAELDMHQGDQLDVGDEDAEQVDLDHRPGAQPFDPGEDLPQVPPWSTKLQTART